MCLKCEPRFREHDHDHEMMMVMILQIIRSKVKTLIEIEENLIQFDECENFEDERVK